MSQDHLTPQVRRALGEAAATARRLDHSLIDTEHLLLGLLAGDGDLAGQVLRDMGLDQLVVEGYVRQLYQDVLAANQNQEIFYASGIDQALSLAEEEALQVGHVSVGTEHLLLGLMRWRESGAATMMMALGVAPGRVRRRMRQMQHAVRLEVGLEEAHRMTSVSELAHRVLNGAIAEAARAGHGSVGVEHVLLVLCRDRRNVAGRALREVGLDVSALENLVAQLAYPSSLAPIFEAAVKEASRLGDHYIGTDHLLLAITEDPTGADVLQELGPDPGEVHARLLEIIDR